MQIKTLICVNLNIINIVFVYSAPFPLNQTVSNKYIEESGKLELKMTTFLQNDDIISS